MDQAWQFIPGAFSFQRLYDQAVSESREGGILVEVGVWMGRSLAYLAIAAREAENGLRVVGVDHCRGTADRTQREAFHGGVWVTTGGMVAHLHQAGVLDNLALIVARSTVAAALFHDDSLDFVMLDAAHDAAGLTADLEAWWPKVRPGGVLAGHDYANPEWPEVRPTVDDFFGEPAGALDAGFGCGSFLVRKGR